MIEIKKDYNETREDRLWKLLGDLYEDWIKHKSVYSYIKLNNASELDEDLDVLREKLKEARLRAKELKETATQEEVAEVAIEIGELDGRIDLCETKRDELIKAKHRANETFAHYRFVKVALEHKDYENDPEEIK